MSADFANYDLSNVTLLYALQDITGGYGADGAIKIEKTKENFTAREGLNGAVVRWATGSVLYKVTVTYLYGSSAAVRMAAIAAADQLANGIGIQPFLCHDGFGTLTLAGVNSWISKPPDPELGAEPKDLTYELMVVADLAILS